MPHSVLVSPQDFTSSFQSGLPYSSVSAVCCPDGPAAAATSPVQLFTATRPVVGCLHRPVITDSAGQLFGWHPSSTALRACGSEHWQHACAGRCERACNLCPLWHPPVLCTSAFLRSHLPGKQARHEIDLCGRLPHVSVPACLPRERACRLGLHVRCSATCSI